MAINLTDGLKIFAPVPVDTRFVSFNEDDRNAIPSNQRYQGLMSYVVEDEKLYVLKGGITNLHWFEIGGVPEPSGWIYNEDSNSVTLGTDLSFWRGVNSVIIGYGKAQGANSLSVGEAETYEDNSIAVGQNAVAGLINSFAFGQNVLANNNNAMAQGRYSEASGMSSHADGEACYAAGDYSFAQGYECEAGGESANAMGEMSFAMGARSSARGYQSEAWGLSSHAFGTWGFAEGDFSFAGIYYAEAIGLASIALGRNVIANADGSTAFGDNTWTQFENQFVCGQWNEGKENTIFEIGIGAVDDRKNGFEVGILGDTRTRGNHHAKTYSTYEESTGDELPGQTEGQPIIMGLRNSGGTIEIQTTTMYYCNGLYVGRDEPEWGGIPEV